MIMHKKLKCSERPDSRSRSLWPAKSPIIRRRCRTLIGVLAAFCCVAPALADNFRVRKTEVVTVSADSPAQSVSLGYNDALAVIFTDNAPFLRGIEIECRIPKFMLSYKNSIAYSLYTAIEPAPSKKEIDYRGKQTYFELMPARLSFVLQIPIVENHGMKTSPYATVLPPVLRSPVFFRLQPVMKGLPEVIEEVEFVIEVKPLLKDEGRFELSLAYPDEIHQPVTITIDEKAVTNPSAPLLLAPGMHHLSIVSEHYRNEVRIFNVEQAKTTKLEIDLQDITPTITFTAPNDVKIFLNDQPLEDVRRIFVVQPGQYTVRFVVGDYEIKKVVDVQLGKSYTVSLIVDIQVAEDQ